MQSRIAHIGAAGLAAGLLSACADQGPVQTVGAENFEPVYLGVETRLLDGDLVSFIVTMRGARTVADVADYAKCAASQYALIRGFGFARHVRTNVEDKDGLWRGDAVYTVSASLPQGRLTLDAEVVVANCRDEGIPTV